MARSTALLSGPSLLMMSRSRRPCSSALGNKGKWIPVDKVESDKAVFGRARGYSRTTRMQRHCRCPLRTNRVLLDCERASRVGRWVTIASFGRGSAGLVARASATLDYSRKLKCFVALLQSTVKQSQSVLGLAFHSLG